MKTVYTLGLIANLYIAIRLHHDPSTTIIWAASIVLVLNGINLLLKADD